MDGLKEEVFGGLAAVERAVSSLLVALGREDEFLTLAIMILLALLAITALWLGLLAAARGLLRGLGMGGADARAVEQEAPRLRDPGGFGPRLPEPARLDVVPAAKPRRPGEPAQRSLSPLAVPHVARSAAPMNPVAPGPRVESLALTEPPAGHWSPVRRVRLDRLPAPAPLRAVVSARPEWTGQVVTGSLQEAGAVEVCRLMVRQAAPPRGGDAVRAVDYRVCGLPRVDAEGIRRPDVLVYTALDRGFVPRAGRGRSGERD